MSSFPGGYSLDAAGAPKTGEHVHLDAGMFFPESLSQKFHSTDGGTGPGNPKGFFCENRRGHEYQDRHDRDNAGSDHSFSSRQMERRAGFIKNIGSICLSAEWGGNIYRCFV